MSDPPLSPPLSTPSETAFQSFGEMAAGVVAVRSTQVALGLDPDPARLWPRALELTERSARDPADPATRAAEAVVAHCTLAIEATVEYLAAVKLQVACFERLGPRGWAALREVTEIARDRGLLVIADAKRGDIDISAAAYGQAFFGETETPYGSVAGIGADAMTVNPLLGADALAPLISAARRGGGGVFVLVRTSNPGAADVQELRLAETHESVSERLAEIVTELGAPGIGPSGLSDVGAVVGATAPERLEALRERMPHAIFLLPGVGAQGGQVRDLKAAFAPGPAGGLISASRGIVDAYERAGGDPARAATAEAQRLRELAWALAA